PVSTTATITVNGVADTAVVSTPDAKTTTENHAAIALTALSLTSADPGTSDDADTYNVTLSVGHGTLALARHANLTGTFSGSSITFSGSLTDVNAALASASYTPTSEFEGTDTLTFTSSTTEEASVGGNTSTPVSTTATITVNGVADTAVVSTPDAKTTTENHAAIALTGLSLTSADPGTSDDADTYNVTLSVGHGTLALASHANLTGTFSGSSITFFGSPTHVKAALASASYTPTSEFEGTDTLTFTSSTTEEASVGGNTSTPVSTTATITVNGVADTAVVSTPDAKTTTENHAAIALTGLSLTSADPGTSDDADTYNVTLSVGHGTLALASHANLTGTFSG